MPTPLVTSDTHFEQIDEATAHHLGIRPRRFVEAGGTKKTALLVEVKSVWVEIPVPPNWTAAYRIIARSLKRL